MGAVGRIALTVTGTVIGSYFGMPGLGTMAGSLLGGVLFPGGAAGQTIEGPRLSDLTVTSSAYGTPINELWGTMRLNGNIIWSDGIKEHKHTEKVRQQSGGKGMSAPSQKQVTYTYTCSFAVGLCQGEASNILRIWADTKLIYDVTGETKVDIQVEDLDFRFYTGSEDQMPDPHVVAKMGDDAPAYRGLCYILFEDLPLEDFANRVPNITVELSKDVVSNPTIVQFPNYFGVGANVSGIQVDASRGRVFAMYRGGLGFPVDEDVFYCWNLRTQQVIWSRHFYGNEAEFWQIVGVDDAGCLLVNRTLIGPGSSEIMRWDGASGVDMPDSLVIPDTVWTQSYGFEMHGQGSLPTVQLYYEKENGLVHWARRRDDTLTYIGTDDLGDDADGFEILGVTKANSDDDDIGYLFAAKDNGTSNTVIRCYRIEYGKSAEDSDLDIVFMNEFSPQFLMPTFGTVIFGGVSRPYFDTSDETLVVGIREYNATDPVPEYLVKYDPEAHEVVWRSQPGLTADGEVDYQGGFSITSFGIPNMERGAPFMMAGNTKGKWRLTDGQYQEHLFPDGYQTFVNFDAYSYYNGYADFTVHYGSNVGPGGAGDVDGTSILFFQGATRGPTTVSTVIKDVALRSGLTLDDIDTINVDDFVLPGYAIARQMTARDIITPLMQMYLFDGFESDFKLRFRKRGQEVIRSLTQADSILRDEDTLKFTETRTQETELPSSLSITFSSPDRDYQQQTFTAKRISNPVPTMWSNNTATMEIAGAFPDDQAKQSAHKALYAAWQARSGYDVSFDWSQIDLDPTDVIEMTMDDGTVYRMRFTNMDVGADMTVEAKGVSEDDAQYTSTVISDGGDFSGQEVQAIGPTRLFVLYTTLLRDNDDTGGSQTRYYVAMGGYGQPGWNAGIAYSGPDANTLEPAGSVISEVTWGTVTSVIPNTDTPWLTDNDNFIDVTLATNLSTGLDNATYDDMLAGVNAAAIIKSNGDIEIIQFGTAVETAEGQWRLSKLFRGRRGTDVFVNNHAAGETFVLLDPASMDRLQLSTSQIGVQQYYKGVQSGRNVDSGELIWVTPNGNDLKPYAPVHVKAQMSGSDINLSWVRRTRINGGLRSGDFEIPLGEVEEKYEVDIYNGTTIVRTLQSTTPTVVYTAANIATDFGTTPVSLRVVVYQMSNAVGRGFGRDITIEVQP